MMSQIASSPSFSMPSFGPLQLPWHYWEDDNLERMDSQAAHHAVDVLDVDDETIQEGAAVCEIVNESHDAVFMAVLDPLV
jgi:hypothetical protein